MSTWMSVDTSSWNTLGKSPKCSAMWSSTASHCASSYISGFWTTFSSMYLLIVTSCLRASSLFGSNSFHIIAYSSASASLPSVIQRA